MTSAYVTRFCEQRPFVPFIMLLANGREHVLSHPDFVSAGEYASVVLMVHASGQIEIIDSDLIVSFRTLHSSDVNEWSP